MQTYNEGSIDFKKVGHSLDSSQPFTVTSLSLLFPLIETLLITNALLDPKSAQIYDESLHV